MLPKSREGREPDLPPRKGHAVFGTNSFHKTKESILWCLFTSAEGIKRCNSLDHRGVSQELSHSILHVGHRSKRHPNQQILMGYCLWPGSTGGDEPQPGEFMKQLRAIQKSSLLVWFFVSIALLTLFFPPLYFLKGFSCSVLASVDTFLYKDAESQQLWLLV